MEQPSKPEKRPKQKMNRGNSREKSMQEHSWLKELGTLGIKQQAHSGLRSSFLTQQNHHEAIPCSNRSESKHLGTHGGERRKSIWQLPFLLLTLGHLKYTAMTENLAQSLAQCPL